MLFSKAIQIKNLVNKWDQERWNLGYGYIKFKCDMFRLGEWYVDISPVDFKFFLHSEMDELITLYAGGGFRMIIDAYESTPIIMMQ